MEYIVHRVNTKEELKNVPNQFGVEIDIRDNFDGRLYLNHDPYILGEDFEEYLKEYNHGRIILNIKSERIEYQVLELLNKYNITNYFFLDCSFPMINNLVSIGEHNVALRYSEYEGMDTLKKMKKKVEWVWVDCFTKNPLDYEIYKEIKSMGYKICFVSPELQNQTDKLVPYIDYFLQNNIVIDAVCSKRDSIREWNRIDYF